MNKIATRSVPPTLKKKTAWGKTPPHKINGELGNQNEESITKYQ